jgi:hypothetical protein
MDTLLDSGWDGKMEVNDGALIIKRLKVRLVAINFAV